MNNTDTNIKCLCGCGGTPIKGQFLPGHDGKLHHMLKLVVNKTIPMEDIPTIVISNRKSIRLISNNEGYKRLINKAAKLMSVHA